jgi:hypothetical protein
MENVLSLQRFAEASLSVPCLSSAVSCDSHNSCESRVSAVEEQ